MRIVLVIFLCSASLFGQNIRNEEDLPLDTVVQPQTAKLADTNSRKMPLAAPAEKPGQDKAAPHHGKIDFYGEISAGNIWSRYEHLPYFWRYAFRPGFGIAGGVAVIVNKPLRLRAGIRLSQAGNKINISDDFYSVNYDSVTNEPVDSQPEHWRGYFRETQYYVSLPVYLDIYLKDIPVYIITGVEPGYLMFVTSYSELYENGVKQPPDPVKDERSYYENFNLVVSDGLGFQFRPKKRFHSELQLVFAWGIFPISLPDRWVVVFRTRELSLRYLLMF